MSSACPELGFELTFRLATQLSSSAFTALQRAFIDVAEGRGLSVGGGANGDEWRYVISRDGAQASDADREALLVWARARPEIRDATGGPLIDLNEAAI